MGGLIHQKRELQPIFTELGLFKDSASTPARLLQPSQYLSKSTKINTNTEICNTVSFIDLKRILFHDKITSWCKTARQTMTQPSVSGNNIMCSADYHSDLYLHLSIDAVSRQFNRLEVQTFRPKIFNLHCKTTLLTTDLASAQNHTPPKTFYRPLKHMWKCSKGVFSMYSILFGFSHIFTFISTFMKIKLSLKRVDIQIQIYSV